MDGNPWSLPHLDVLTSCVMNRYVMALPLDYMLIPCIRLLLGVVFFSMFFFFFYWPVFFLNSDIKSFSVLICRTLNYHDYLFILEHFHVLFYTGHICGLSHESIKLDLAYSVWWCFSRQACGPPIPQFKS